MMNNSLEQQENRANSVRTSLIVATVLSCVNIFISGIVLIFAKGIQSFLIMLTQGESASIGILLNFISGGIFIWALIGVIFFGFAVYVFLKYKKLNLDELVEKKTLILIWGIAIGLSSFILIASSWVNLVITGILIFAWYNLDQINVGEINHD